MTRFVFDPDSIERDEFSFEPNSASTGQIDDFLRITRLAFGTLNKTNLGFQVDFAVKNTSPETFVLDLNERFFGMEDDQGRAAKLVYFCCPGKEILSPGGERTVQLTGLSNNSAGKGEGSGCLPPELPELFPVSISLIRAADCYFVFLPCFGTHVRHLR